MMTASKRILAYEAVGFGVLLVLLWADEALDLPAVLLGAGPTPTNVAELALEGALVLLLGAAVLGSTARLLGRVHHLEGLMHVCGFCGKVRDRDGWVPMEEYLERHSEAELRHTFCMTCLIRQYGRDEETGRRP